MSSRGEVLKSLQLSLTEDSPDAQVAWDAILCGQDASVEAAKPFWEEAIVLPAFSRWKASKHRLLVVANRALCAVFEAEMAHWVKADIASLTETSSSGPSGYLLLAPEEISKEKLQIAGEDECDQAILVILHAKDESTSLLRSKLQLLPVPNQVIMGVELWDESTRQLAAEILGDAVHVSLNARPADQERPPSCTGLASKDQTKGEKDQDEHALLVASFMANIICRSDDHDFRAACRALIKAGADGTHTPAEGATSTCDSEDAEIRQGIASMMAKHNMLTSKTKPKASKSGKSGKKRAGEIMSSEAKRLAAAEWDDCSESLDF